MKQRILSVAICGLLLATAWQAEAQDAELHYGRPGLSYPSGDRDLKAYIYYASYGGTEIAKESRVLGDMAFSSWVIHDHRSRCVGYLFVSRSGIRYSGTNDKHEFDAPWAEVKEVKRSDKKGDPRITVRLNKKDFHFRPAYIDMEDNWQTHDMSESGRAGFMADFFLLSVEDFDAAVRQFESLAANLPGYRFRPRPLSPEQMAAVESAERKGEAAEQAGRILEATGHYLAAVNTLPESPDLEVNWRVRSRLLELVAKLESPPSPPEEARRRMAYAVTALEGATTPAQYDKALAEFYAALKAAPWWAPLYFDTAMVLEQGGYLASARSHLELYLLAAPNAEDREAVQQKIYPLEYKAKNQ